MIKTEMSSFLRADPAVTCSGNLTQMTLRVQQQILTRGFCVLRVTQKCQGVVVTLSFLVSKWRGEVWGASAKPSAFISCSRIQGQELLRTTDLD